MNEQNDEFEEVRDGMQQIIDAFRIMTRIEQGSRKVQPMGTAFVVGDGNVRYAITADHVLNGPEDKFIGIDEGGSVRWPRRFSRLVALQPGLPNPDVAWATLEPPQDTSQIGPFIHFGLASALVHDTPGPAYLVVGQPSSKAKVRGAQSYISSKVMQAQVQLASEDVCQKLGIDLRVQAAYTYTTAARRGESGEAIELANPAGMSGGAVLATHRAPRGNGKFIMVPFIVGVLTDFSTEHDTFIATRIEHIWATIGRGRRASEPLYRRQIGSFGAA